MATVTSESKVFTWWIWPSNELEGMNDEFVVVAECFRVRMMGPIFEVSFQGSGPCAEASAKALADRHVAILNRQLPRQLILFTQDEFTARTQPPQPHVVQAFFRRHRSRSEVRGVVRDARNEMLASTDQALRESYNYLDDAHNASRPEDVSAAAYKAIEVLELPFGGEHAAAKVLKTLKDAKTAANQLRHIREKVQNQPKILGHPLELTRQAIREYEGHLLSRRGCI